MRATLSVTPPAAKGTTTLMVCVGRHSAAFAAVVHSKTANPSKIDRDNLTSALPFSFFKRLFSFEFGEQTIRFSKCFRKIGTADHRRTRQRIPSRNTLGRLEDGAGMRDRNTDNPAAIADDHIARAYAAAVDCDRLLDW